MDRRLTAYVLKYLLEHRFESKAEMARQLGMRQRTIEKVFANLDVAKAGTAPTAGRRCSEGRRLPMPGGGGQT